jgi:integration host factor subunit beta
MNGEQLNRLLAMEEDISQKKAKAIIDIVFAHLTQALSAGERIDIRGFGTFKVKTYEGYTGRNPKSGVRVSVKPKKLPAFKVGKGLKERLNNGFPN